jgi:XTP/dITP diphosphohydrolase
LRESEDFSAAFICVLCLALPDGTERFYEGRVDGTLTFPPRGSHGFAFDPIFVPMGDARTFAEMDAVEKARQSHRTKALSRFVSEAVQPSGSND